MIQNLILFLSLIFPPDEIQIQKGKWLAQNQLYDEAYNTLKDMDHHRVNNPTELLFYRACSNFYLLNKKEALTDLNNLLYYEEAPKRFIRVARLMIADIQPLEEDSLDEISRLMADNSRRLGLERTNESVQNQQQLIIDKLDKLIDKTEKQQQQATASKTKNSKKQQGQQQQSSPLGDSKIMEDKGDGDIATKQFAEKSWGNLPPRKRQEAVQKLGKDLPFHYREAIEAYMRKIAIGR